MPYRSELARDRPPPKSPNCHNFRTEFAFSHLHFRPRPYPTAVRRQLPRLISRDADFLKARDLRRSMQNLRKYYSLRFKQNSPNRFFFNDHFYTIFTLFLHFFYTFFILFYTSFGAQNTGGNTGSRAGTKVCRTSTASRLTATDAPFCSECCALCTRSWGIGLARGRRVATAQICALQAKLPM